MKCKYTNIEGIWVTSRRPVTTVPRQSISVEGKMSTEILLFEPNYLYVLRISISQTVDILKGPPVSSWQEELPHGWSRHVLNVVAQQQSVSQEGRKKYWYTYWLVFVEV